ncbi:MAG: hypothetical protein K0R94_1222, partial [Burkholderiales bacterium]|nr:hypothetical protein [Burkholderiales bacterium]
PITESGVKPVTQSIVTTTGSTAKSESNAMAVKVSNESPNQSPDIIGKTKSFMPAQKVSAESSTK